MESVDQEKQYLLERIRQLEEENASLRHATLNQPSPPPPTPSHQKGKLSNIWHFRRKVGLVEVFSFIGASIVSIGVVILIALIGM